jgi:hypothetical protein
VTTLDALAGTKLELLLLERFGVVPLSAPWLRELAHYEGPPDRPEAVRLPGRRVIPIDAAFLADLRPLPGTDLLVPAALLNVHPPVSWKDP